MKISILAGVSGLALLLAACGGSAPGDTTIETEPVTSNAAETETEEVSGFGPVADVASGSYSLEPTHAFLFFEVGHNGGIAKYRVDFTDFDADLQFDAEAPEQSTLSVTINPAAVETNYPGDYKAGHPDSPYDSWNEDLAMSENWLNAGNYPEITFTSADIVRTGESTGEVTGELTFLGTSETITLDVSYGGVANPPWFGDRDVIGFTASTTLNRSDFGMTAMIPMIGEEVSVTFSGEFLQDEE